MAQASRKDRKIRRFRNERRLAMKMVEVALAQRDQARFIAGALDQRIQGLEKLLKEKEPNEQPESVVLSEGI